MIALRNQIRENKKQIALALFSFAFLSGAYCQNAITDALKGSLDQYTQAHLQEKIFVHTDKSFYLAGEILWFKIYAVEGSTNKPLDLSKVAYLEIVNSEQKPVLQAKISLNKGKGYGSLFLPISINSGNYLLRTYTSWMKNFNPDGYFQKKLTIVNSLKQLSMQARESDGAYDIQFFPEGGNLVTGIPSKVGFRVVDRNGKGVDFSGAITDQNNDTAALFHPQIFGLGHFNFTPLADKKYKALLRFGTSNIVVSDIPSVYPQGYVMNLERLPGTDKLRITVSTNLNISGGVLYLLVHTRQVVKEAQIGGINSGKVIFEMDKSKLGEGISQFTIFDVNRQPLCERIYFERPLKSLHIDGSPSQTEYGQRKKVTLNIHTQESTGNSQPADLSLSVFRLDSLQNGDPEDINSYFWLSSDLRGNVESPDYYLKNQGPEVEEAIDNLMLTQGWRRFKWDEILKDTSHTFEFIPEYEGQIITGKITDKISGSAVENVLTYLSVPGTRYRLGCSFSDKKGQVQFNMKDVYGASELVIQTDNRKDSNYRMDVLSPFSEKFSPNPIPAFELSENLKNDIQFHSISTQVQNVYLNDRLQQFYSPEMRDSTAFYGQPDKKYFLDDYTRFQTMEEVMREYVANVTIRKHGDRYNLSVIDEPNHVFFEDDPLIMLDGVPVFDATKIITFDPLKIKKIEVMSRECFLGPMIASGIVSYSTYQGDLSTFQLDPGSLVVEYEGLQLQREFYAPVYETDQQVKSRLPDFRDLLFWSPNLHSDNNGNAQVSFYTSDRPGKYAVVVQGLTEKGFAGSQSFSFDVTQ
jgi:hypothetical protein